jgi:hypothetical protein
MDIKDHWQFDKSLHIQLEIAFQFAEEKDLHRYTETRYSTDIYEVALILVCV